MSEVRKYLLLCATISVFWVTGRAQVYHVGFTSLVLKDSSRIYKADSEISSNLHFRPVELDIWYPAEKSTSPPLLFKDLFQLFEDRAVRYDDTEDFTGVSEEMAALFVAELGMGVDPHKLLHIKTESYKDAKPSMEKFPLVVYLAGFNGMGFENYTVLEELAENGFVVVAIWSVGRYPGNMTNRKEDMLEQVYDAEFAINYLNKNTDLVVDSSKIGLLGCSWGGMSAAVLAKRLPSIKSMVSFDGTETHYFGEPDMNHYFGGASGSDNDNYIRDIHDSDLLGSDNANFSYLYFESGDKIDDYKPTSEYHYFKELNSEKYYLRFENSDHADFTCIPYILEASENSVNTYSSISEASTKFFEYTLKGKTGFTDQWQRLLSRENTTDQPFKIDSIQDIGHITTIKGKVIDKNSQKPLQYVNVGILNQGIGTVTDGAGLFQLEVPEHLQSDTLRISMLGYKAFEAVISNLRLGGSQLNVGLEVQISKLDEVVVSARAFKKKVLGNKTKSKFLGTGFSHDQLGAEMGVRINVNKQTLVDSFKFHISYNRLSAQSVFRLNFYRVVSGRPGPNLLERQILVPINPKQTGEITVNLKPYSIVLEDDVIVSLEWVETGGSNSEGEAIFFSLGLFNSGTLYKESSQAPFKKLNSLGVGFNLDVRI